MDIKTKKQKEFYNTIVKHLVRETDADYVNKTMRDIRNGKIYVKYIFYFPWDKNMIGAGRICRILNYDLHEEYKTFKININCNLVDNFLFKWGNYIKYVGDIYGADYEECFTIWEIFSKYMKEKYELD